jgi:broad specificity phosphatase PhoE
MPSAVKHHIQISAYEPGNLYSSKWLSLCFGKTILIVGHSNTIPQLVNELMKSDTFQNIPDDENGFLFRVEISEEDRNVEVFQL